LERKGIKNWGELFGDRTITLGGEKVYRILNGVPHSTGLKLPKVSKFLGFLPISQISRSLRFWRKLERF